MDLNVDESKAILSKSLSLIEKTIQRLRQIDYSQFPTRSSDDSRKLLLAALDLLRDPQNLQPMDSAVLYKNLLSLQELADIISQSSTDRIWPLVSYCDEIWKVFFGEDGPKLFYSLTAEHNFSIFRFSECLRHYLQALIPKSMIDNLLSGRKIYCLQLSSVEDANLPLYANIGHEFGHAVFDLHSAEIRLLLHNNIKVLLDSIKTDLEQKEPKQSVRRHLRIFSVLNSISTELFCDLIGSLLMGPAFFLSLYEMSWGQIAKKSWIAFLSPDNKDIRGYPGFLFRLHCIKRWAKIDSFATQAKAEFASLDILSIRNLADILTTIPVDHTSDTIRVHPGSDDDADIIKDILNSHIPELKQVLENFTDECLKPTNKWHPKSGHNVDAAKVAALLLRLEHRILPNIEPDSSLLGKCATFTSILTASALYRLRFLVQGTDNSKKLSQESGIIDGLTAKALEVTLVHHEYNKWMKKKGGRNGRAEQG